MCIGSEVDKHASYPLVLISGSYYIIWINGIMDNDQIYN